jgi:hypothetical protein
MTLTPKDIEQGKDAVKRFRFALKQIELGKIRATPEYTAWVRSMIVGMNEVIEQHSRRRAMFGRLV